MTISGLRDVELPCEVKVVFMSGAASRAVKATLQDNARLSSVGVGAAIEVSDTWKVPTVPFTYVLRGHEVVSHTDTTSADEFVHAIEEVTSGRHAQLRAAEPVAFLQGRDGAEVGDSTMRR